MIISELERKVHQYKHQSYLRDFRPRGITTATVEGGGTLVLRRRVSGWPLVLRRKAVVGAGFEHFLDLLEAFAAAFETVSAAELSS